MCGFTRGTHRVAGDPAAHTHFGRKGRDALQRGVASRGTVVAHIAGLHRDADAKDLGQFSVGLDQIRRHAVGHDHVGAGLDEQRASTGMQIQVDIGPAQDVVSDIPGDLLCWQTVVIAGKDAVKVQVVDRRGAAAHLQGRGVEAGQQNQLPNHVACLDLPHQLGDDYGPLVLIAVNGARDHHHRPMAVFDGGGGEGDYAPSVVIGRVGQVQRADLFAVLVPVDVAEYGCAHWYYFMV